MQAGHLGAFCDAKVLGDGLAGFLIVHFHMNENDLREARRVSSEEAITEKKQVRTLALPSGRNRKVHS